MNERIDTLLRQLADDDVRHEAPPHVEAAVMRAWRSHGPVADGRWLVACGRWLVAGRPVARGWWPVARRQLGSQRRRLEWVAFSLMAAAVLIAAIVLRPQGRFPDVSMATGQSVTSESISIRENSSRFVPPAAPIVTAQSSPGVVASRPSTAAPERDRYQPPATSHQPGATRQEPPATSHQLPATAYQPYVLVGGARSDAAPLNVVRVRMARSALATLGLPLPNPDAAALVDVDVFVGEDGIARAIRPVALVSSVSQE